ncbi:PH domain-containing protein [Streptomyces sp. NPDC048277]|uniref:PH domain-containing protein n=1 Tax=Streptomyces sp. NPDC048277 TaxID=3155027 RepID=UPI0033C86668
MTSPLVKDRIYRSPQALIGGVLLLAIVGWLGIDALIKGHGHTPWLALAALILVVPLIVGFTLRPAVFAGEDRLRVRNPFRVITVPWGEVASLRSGYSNEVITKSGAKYQLWAIPVSLRGRKKAARRKAKAEADARRGSAGSAGSAGRGLGGFGGGIGGIGGGFGGIGGGFGGGFGGPRDIDDATGPVRAETDKVMDDLREMLENRGGAEAAQGEVTVRWAYEVAAPAVAGAVLLAILLAVG